MPYAITLPDGGGYGPKIDEKGGVSRQKERFGPDIAPISRFGGASKLAQQGGLWQISARSVGPLAAADSHPSTCCRSSVVEHSIGNGEVDSSILSGSTIYAIGDLDFIGNSVLGATQECHTEPWFP
jgi:hypothetical protein